MDMRRTLLLAAAFSAVVFSAHATAPDPLRVPAPRDVTRISDVSVADNSCDLRCTKVRQRCEQNGGSNCAAQYDACMADC